MNENIEVTEADLRLFIGKRYEYYKDRWEAIESMGNADRKKWNNWSWASFFTAYWLGWRKMYVYLLYYLVGYATLDWILSSVGIDTKWLGMGLAFGFGTAGASFYKWHAVSTVKRIKKKFPPEQQEREIIKAGGTSGAALIVVIILQVLMLGIEVFNKWAEANGLSH